MQVTIPTRIQTYTATRCKEANLLFKKKKGQPFSLVFPFSLNHGDTYGLLGSKHRITSKIQQANSGRRSKRANAGNKKRNLVSNNP
jgi:hypothetical protein